MVIFEVMTLLVGQGLANNCFSSVIKVCESVLLSLIEFEKFEILYMLNNIFFAAHCGHDVTSYHIVIIVFDQIGSYF